MMGFWLTHQHVLLIYSRLLSRASAYAGIATAVILDSRVISRRHGEFMEAPYARDLRLTMS